MTATSDRSVAGMAAEAINSLTPKQIAFIHNLPKAELHAHLNGSIPISELQAMAKKYIATDNSQISSDALHTGLNQLLDGVELDEIHQFFDLFPAIYALTSTPKSLARAARAVLRDFLEGENPQCVYLELRSTPRKTANMTRMAYVEAVLDEVEKYRSDQAALIVSLDRRMEESVVKECVDIAVECKRKGRRIVGIDLCGSPTAGNLDLFSTHIRRAKEAGLSVTLHIAETVENSPEDTMKLLSFAPDRLGHATFLNDETKQTVLTNKTCIEMCLTSNILSKTVPTLDDHHIRYYLKHDHPISICTDDVLVFRNSMMSEYALLLAPAPIGLELSEAEVERIAQMSLENRFKSS